MNLFTRISATIGASAENAVNRFENHDAIAHSALVEARQALTKARIRHRRLTGSVEEIRTRLDESEKQATLWTDRARRLADTDEARALECLAQRKRCHEQIEEHTQNLKKHESLEQDMTQRLQRMEERLRQMVNQRNEMRSRESIAKASQVMDRIDHDGKDGVEAVFERWELNINDSEIASDIYQDEIHDIPSIQRDFEKEEQTAALKNELAELVAHKDNKHHG